MYPVLEIRGLGALTQAGLHQVCRLRELEPVLYDTKCLRNFGLDVPAYETYRDCCDDEAKDLLRKNGLRYDVTVMPPLMLGEEYVKTLGHYHLPFGEADPHPEIFEVLEGEAEFLVQKQCGEEVDNVTLLIAKEGEKVLAPPGRGHVIINASPRRLVVGHLVSRSCVEASDQYVKRRGAAFYVLTKGRLVSNLNYSSVPEVRALRTETPPFLEKESGLVEIFLKDPNRLALLNESSRSTEWDQLDGLISHGSAVPSVVLSGGRGSGLRPVIYHLPKAMVPAGQSPPLEYVLQLLGSRNFLIFLNTFLATYAALMLLTLISMVKYS